MGDFSDKAEAIIAGAKAEAKDRQSYWVHDVDILLSLLKYGSGTLAGELLKNAEVNYSNILLRTAGQIDFNITDNAPWTVDAQNVLNRARESAKELGHRYCETEHILVGLLRVNGPAKQIICNSAAGFSPSEILSKIFTFWRIKEEKQEIRVHVRPMIRCDRSDVLSAEEASFEFPWLEDDFVRYLCQGNCVGMVAEYEDKVVGFMICQLHKNRINILNFAVAPPFRRKGVGSQMIAKLIGKLSPQRRNRIIAEVRETNLAAQLFFRANDFRAVNVLHDSYDDTSEDAYAMEYKYQAETNEFQCLPATVA